MKMKVAAYFKDGSSAMVEFEKPAGCHPEAAYVGQFAAVVAEQEYPGRTCVRIARPMGVPLKNGLAGLVENTIWEQKE